MLAHLTRAKLKKLACACTVAHDFGVRTQDSKHVYVLRCNPLVIQGVNPAKEYLTVKPKRLEDVSFTDYHW